jgi:hypothetical protein
MQWHGELLPPNSTLIKIGGIHILEDNMQSLVFLLSKSPHRKNKTQYQ